MSSSNLLVYIFILRLSICFLEDEKGMNNNSDFNNTII